MRPLFARLDNVDRRALALGGVVLVALVAAAVTAVATSRGGGERAEVVEPPTATATPTPASVLPPLPAGCQLLKTLQPGPFERPVVGERGRIVLEAQECAALAWREIPLAELTVELTAELDPPDGPAQLLVPLTAAREQETLRWSGTITFPLGGNWRGSLRLGGRALDEPIPLFWQVPAGPNLVSKPGLPLPALEYELTVLNVDRPGEPARWPALESGGMAWIPGAAPGEAARVVWVQARDGREWVVAGDPTTGIATPLFEVEMPVTLHGAPDGRAFVVVDRIYDQPKRIRFYDAQRSKLMDVGTSRLDPRPASWAPDSSAVLIGGDRVQLLESDGSLRSSAATRPFEWVAWSPDSTWAVMALQATNPGETAEVVRLDAHSGAVTGIVDAASEDRVQVWPPPAVSPDGRRFALAWWDPSEPGGRISVLDRDDPRPVRLEDRVVASYPMPGAYAKLQWLTSMSWSPSGNALIISMFTPTDGQIYRAKTSIQVVELASKAVRLVVEPREGHYAYGPMWVSADGRAVLKVWHSCVGCDGGRSGIDVIDLAGGAIVRTVDGGSSLGTIDGVRHLLSSPDGLLSVRGLEAPRVLMPGRWNGSTRFTVTPSPDGNRLAVVQTSGRTSPAIAVAVDGSSRTVLGYVRPEARVIGVRDASTAFVLDFQAGWGWSSFADGVVTALPQQGDARPETALETASAISPDRSMVGYWVPGAVKPEVTLQLLDLRTGTVASSVATSQQTKGMYLAMSPDGKRVLYPEGDALVAVDVPSRSTLRIALQRLGNPAGIGIVSSATHGPGGTFEVVVGDRLWRIDPISGDAQVVTAQQPSPGGWRSPIELSRSPNGQRLVALTTFGLFELQPDGSWRLASGAGIDNKSPGGTSIVWSPDSRHVAYLGSDGLGGPGAFGIVVVGLDGSGAYELVKRDVYGGQLKLLDWLPDGRIVYALVAQAL